jgi:hypothetical protein
VRPLVQQACALLNRPISELARGSEERTLIEAYVRQKQSQCAFDFDDMISIVCERVPKFHQSPLSLFKLVNVLFLFAFFFVFYSGWKGYD